MNKRENWLKCIEFRYPERIPCEVFFSPATWYHYRETLEEVVLSHPRLFPEFEKGQIDFDSFPPGYEGYHRDNWGCLWYTPESEKGIRGQVVESPLADWDVFDDYHPPDVNFKSESGNRNWEQTKQKMQECRNKGLPVIGDGERLFDRLYLLRGFENLMMDIATDDPHLSRLINMLLEHELALVQKWLEISVDAILFHSDLGTQNGLMINPQKFRKYIKPMFKEIFMLCRDNNVHVLLSSDGNLLEIVDDLIECGVSLHDPQIRANTLAGIEKKYKDRMCIELDLDRQMFPFCKPQDIKNQIEQSIETLNLPQGGLMLCASICGADVPLENIEALCNCLEKLC